MTRKYRAPNDLRRTYSDFYPYVDTDLSYREYRRLMTDLFQTIVKEVIINKRVWKWPFGLGRLAVRMRKKPQGKQPINYKESKKQRREVRFRNLHTDGRIFVLLYQAQNYENYRSVDTLSHHNVYNLRTSRDNRAFLQKVIKEGAEDPFTKTYTVPYEAPKNFHSYLHR